MSDLYLLAYRRKPSGEMALVPGSDREAVEAIVEATGLGEPDPDPVNAVVLWKVETL